MSQPSKSATEHAEDAVRHARNAVRLANKAQRWGWIGFSLAVLAFAIQTVGLILRYTG
jgi:hypothetical protein